MATPTGKTNFPHYLCQGEFNEAMTKSFVEFHNEAMKNNATDACILIDSPGGAVHRLNAMLSIMESSSIRYHTVAIGMAASCGCLLLAGGDVRYATPRADIMFHDMSAGVRGQVSEMEEGISRIKKFSKRVMKQFSKRTDKKLSWWLDTAKSFETKAFWFQAKEAKKLGIIDHIGLPKIKEIVKKYKIKI